MRYLLLTILLVTTVATSRADELILDLNGFRIGQYREVVKNELGDPIKNEKYDDGFEYEIFLVKPDTSLYMIFEYSPINLELIWSVQLTGGPIKTDFKGLALGMDKSKIIKLIGKPSREIDVGEYGKKWEYDNTNYSVEVNLDGKLSSIKITDQSYKMFPRVDVTKLPDFSYWSGILSSGTNLKVSNLLSPDMEIYTSDSIYFFGYKMATELEHDNSGIFKLISNLAKDLEKVNTKDIDQYEENVRVSPGQDPLHVCKIKNGHPIKEIVFKYRFGKYLVWEIKS